MGSKQSDMKIISVTRDEAREVKDQSDSTFWIVEYKGRIPDSYTAIRLFMFSFGIEMRAKIGNAYLKSITASDLDTEAKKGSFSIQMDWLRCSPVSDALNN